MEPLESLDASVSSTKTIIQKNKTFFSNDFRFYFIIILCILLFLLFISLFIWFWIQRRKWKQTEQISQLCLSYLLRDYYYQLFYIIYDRLVQKNYFLSISRKKQNNDLFFPTIISHVEHFLQSQEKTIQKLSSSPRQLSIYSKIIHYLQTPQKKEEQLPYIFLFPDVIIFNNGNDFYMQLLKHVTLAFVGKSYFTDLSNQESKDFFIQLFQPDISVN